MVRTVDINGKASPQNVQGVLPQIRVEVDTQRPLVILRPSTSLATVKSASNGRFAKKISTSTASFSNTALPAARIGSRSPLKADAQDSATGIQEVSGNVEARLKRALRFGAKMKAWSHRTFGCSPAGDSGGGGDSRQMGGNYSDPDAGRTLPPGSSRAEPRYVNSKRISLNYEIKEEGPSGTSAVELWVTRDGRSWNKHTEDASHQPPLNVEVAEEGVYGFTLVVRSGVGLSERRPRGGDSPQAWVKESICTLRSVAFVHAEVDPGPDTGKLTIAWKATDKNLGREPITLSFSKEPDGPWTQIAAGQPNSGSYVWHMPPTGIPYQFYVQVEATDKAGNVGKRRTQELVKVDLKKPKGVILDVGPATSAGPKPETESNKR